MRAPHESLQGLRLPSLGFWGFRGLEEGSRLPGLRVQGLRV